MWSRLAPWAWLYESGKSWAVARRCSVEQPSRFVRGTAAAAAVAMVLAKARIASAVCFVKYMMMLSFWKMWNV